MIQLKNNYRNHEAIVQIASRLFYDDSLIPMYPPGHDSFVSPRKSSVLRSLVCGFYMISITTKYRSIQYCSMQSRVENLVNTVSSTKKK